jgi:hypothetical protein
MFGRQATHEGIENGDIDKIRAKITMSRKPRMVR